MNIYTGNLSREVTEEDLRAAFKEYGEVSFVNIVKDRASKVSVGFGFVGMVEQGDGEAAVAGMNGKELKGKAIKVNEARPVSL